MRKAFTLVLLALAIMIVAVSCDDPKHEHSYDANVWEKDGTSHWHVCTTCGEKVGVAEHTLETTKAKEPTCTEKGWDEYVTCSICGYSTYKEKPAEHTIVKHEAQAATCEKIGWDAYETCSKCDYTTYKEIPALGHDVTSEGKCTRCAKDGFKITSIGDTEYTSLASAITALGDSDTITLLQNITLTESLDVTGNVEINMNGKTITPVEGASISIGEEAVLIVTNVAENQKDFVSSEAKISLTYDDTILYCYCSFDTAMLQAADGMMLTLTDDVTVNNEYTIDKSLTIDLNEKTLTVIDSDPFISVASSDPSKPCVVTIKNGAVLAKRTNENITKGEHQVIFSVDVGGSIILDDVNVTDSTDYGYIFSACGSSQYSSQEEASYVSKVVIKNGSTITTTGESAEAIIASKNLYSDNSPILIEVEGSTISATGTGALAVDIGGDKGSVSLNITGSTIKGDACALGVQGNGTADVKNSTIELTQTAKDRLPINAPIAMMSTTGKTNLTLTGVTSKYVEGAADGKIWLSNSITNMSGEDVITVNGDLDGKTLNYSVKGDKESSSYLN